MASFWILRSGLLVKMRILHYLSHLRWTLNEVVMRLRHLDRHIVHRLWVELGHMKLRLIEVWFRRYCLLCLIGGLRIECASFSVHFIAHLNYDYHSCRISDSI